MKARLLLVPVLVIVEVVLVNVLVAVTLDVVVVVETSAHVEAPVQALKTFGGANMAAPWKEQPRRGFDVSPCRA